MINKEEIDNKEARDALHMLLHCALKDKEFETQKEQFNIVMAYIEQLEEICTGKSIQELGVSNLYESNELREQIEEAKKRDWKDITVEIDEIEKLL